MSFDCFGAFGASSKTARVSIKARAERDDPYAQEAYLGAPDISRSPAVGGLERFPRRCSQTTMPNLAGSDPCRGLII